MVAPYPIIDADGHIGEHERLFEEYLDPSVRALRPKTVLMPTGARFWLVEGKLIPRPFGARGPGAPMGFHASGGGMKVTHARDGSLDDIEGRLRDLDDEGIEIQVLYPTTCLAVCFLDNKDLAIALSRAYNDYASERCKLAVDRLKWMAVVPLQDPQEAAKELRRAVEQLGAKGAIIPGTVGERLLDSEDLFPFYEEADRLGVALGVHAVTGAYNTVGQECFDNFYYTRAVAMPFALMVGMMTIIGGGILERLRHVRFAFLETGAGWVPYWGWWLGELFEKGGSLGRHGSGTQVEPLAKYFDQEPLPYLRTAPQETLFKTGRCFFSCEPDEDVNYIGSIVGEDNLIVGSDYPHGDYSERALLHFQQDERLAESLRRKVLCDNPRRLYGLASTAL
jgi:predicted TIM-barrel fold metal-dependent hydrolase